MVLAILGFVIGLVILIWFLFTLTDIKRATQGTEEALRELNDLIKNRFQPQK